jgi:hypothetical protein
MSAHHNFIQKAMCLVMNGKKMMAEAMEKGLANMSAAVKTASN